MSAVTMRAERGVMRTFAAFAGVAVAALIVTGCGGSNHGGMGDAPMGHHRSTSTDRPVVPGAPTVSIVADALTFTPNTIEMTAGQPVTIELTSRDVEHDLFVQGIGHVVHARPNQTEQGGLTIDDPGTYRFWCTVAGHKAGGMVGTISVAA